MSRTHLMAENRHFVRYRLCLPVFFRWNDKHGKLHRGEGLSRDISLRGIYVWSEAQPPDRSDVVLEILLPHHEGPEPLRMETEAQVMRIDEGKNAKRSAGFAAAGAQLTLLNNKLQERRTGTNR